MLTNIDFALIHKVQQCLHLRVIDILEEYNWMGVGVLQENALEIRTACREYGLVRLERLSDTGQGHVTECFSGEQRAENVREVGWMIVPP